MTIQEFKEQFKQLNAYTLGDYILFSNNEVWNNKTGESQFFETLDDACEFLKPQIEELKEVIFHLEGGSGNRSNATSLFGGQNAQGGAIHPDLPAKMNRLYNGNNMSQSHTLDTFRKQHADAKSESAILMDDDGFVSIYRHGDKSSVGWYAGELTGGNLIHNHPNGSNFSKADLDTWSTTGLKSITATSTHANYQITKGNNFKANAFIKGLNSAKTTQSDYNKAVDQWLKANQKKFGYTYKSTRY